MQLVIRSLDLLTTRNGSSIEAQIAVFLADAVYDDRRPATLAFYRATLYKFLWWADQAGLPADPEAITPQHCKEFLVYVRTTPARWGSTNAHAQRLPKPATVDAYWRALAAFWNWWAAQPLAHEPQRVSPMRRVERPKVPRSRIAILELTDIEQLLAQCNPALERDCRDAAITIVLFSTGMRASEICGWRLADYDMDSGEWSVVSAKTGHVRGARLAPPARRAVRAWLVNWRCRYDTDAPTLFVSLGNRPGQPLTPNGLAQMLRERGQAAGIEGKRVSPHTFRYSFATTYLQNGGDLADLSLLMGHSTLQMTMRYDQMTRTMLTTKHQQFDPAAHLNMGAIERARRAAAPARPPDKPARPPAPAKTPRPGAPPHYCQAPRCANVIPPSRIHHHPQQKYCSIECAAAARRVGGQG